MLEQKENSSAAECVASVPAAAFLWNVGGCTCRGSTAR
jgi:hypothetical protein